tara:strand:- start:222 stop:599 length:378 start_codon:yes stop_codon:yes gene_type:complete
MFNQIITICEKLGMGHFGDFVTFARNRQRLKKQFNHTQNSFLGIINLALNIVRKKQTLSSAFINMSEYATEYVVFKMNNDDIKELEKSLISLGRYLEIKHQQVEDPLLREISKYGNSEMAQILRL